MRVQLECGPEGAPNFCFGLYATGTHKEEGIKKGDCIQFIQTDWDYPGLASMFGWIPCECGRTDGTVDCEHKTSSDMIADAYDFLAARSGRIMHYNP